MNSIVKSLFLKLGLLIRSVLTTTHGTQVTVILVERIQYAMRYTMSLSNSETLSKSLLLSVVLLYGAQLKNGQVTCTT